MHASLALAALAAASLVLAAPAPAHSLVRRAPQAQVLLPAAAIAGAGISIGLGAAAVHKNKDNAKILQSIDGEVQMLKSELASIEGTQHAAHTLHRRQIGTITSSVAIHRSKKLRKRMDELDHEIDDLEHQANACLAAEGLHDEAAEHHEAEAEEHEEHEEAAEEDGDHARRLERRQFGLILGPIATAKNKKDRQRLLAMQDRVTHVHNNVDRCKAAVNARMALRTRPVAVMASMSAPVLASRRRPVVVSEPFHDVDDGVLHASDERHGATYGRRESSYGYRPNVQVQVTHSHEHHYD
jgi:hypothetical protein